LSVQENLSRVLHEQKLQRLGGKDVVTLQSRLIALTDADLEAAVEAGQFREDLYRRLETAKLWVPPLRERASDILPIAEHMFGVLSKKHGKPHLQLGEKTKTFLQTHSWPGNLRQLQTTLDRAVVTAQTQVLEPADFPAELQTAGRQNGRIPLRSLEELEREAIVATLANTDYQIGRSAQILGISRKTLLEKRKKFGLK
jgi:DNA-binding NtrC family response regulator